MLMSVFNGMNVLLHLFKFVKLFIMNIYIIDHIIQLCAETVFSETIRYANFNVVLLTIYVDLNYLRTIAMDMSLQANDT